MINLSVNDLYGIYIHIPFCLNKCSYCNFYSITNLSKIDDYFLALNSELKFYGNKGYEVDTIYFGGGTPSIVSVKYIYNIINYIYKYFNVVSNPEITLEVNPGTINYFKLREYNLLGINRLNIGMQSIIDKNLIFLGRLHNSCESLNVFYLAKKIGFQNLGIDLIYSIPEQSVYEWKKEIEKIVQLKPEHLSCYLLSFEYNTPMGNKTMSGEIIVPSDRITSSMLSFTSSFLKNHGYCRYEISNFSKTTINNPNYYSSKHNSKYWNFNNYLGFGPSSHSYVNNKRWWNTYCIDNYIKSLLISKNLPIENIETLTFEQQITEFMYLGLRQNKGVSISMFEMNFGKSIFNFFDETILLLVKDGFIHICNDSIMLTNKGFLFLDSIALLFCL